MTMKHVTYMFHACILMHPALLHSDFFFSSGSSPLLSPRPLPIWGYTFIFLTDGERDVWE